MTGSGAPAWLAAISNHLAALIPYSGVSVAVDLVEGGVRRLRVVDDASAYFRPQPEELEPEALYNTLKDLLRP